MAKYTIIIPTLWESNRTNRLIDDLYSCEYVDEIIIIDNSYNKIIDFYKNDKIRIISKGENIYVNPAWNLGIELSRNDSIALCNDDINFNPNIFELITPNELLKFGIIGQSEFNYNCKNTDEPIIEEIIHDERNWGWGCLIFLNRQNWINIPDDIKIWYGDDFIFKCNPSIKSIIKNFNIETEMSTTSDKQIWNNRKQEDYNNYINYLMNGRAK